MEYFRFRIFRANYFKFCARSSPLFSITEKHSFIHFISVGRFLFVLVLCLSPIDAACVVHATLTFARTIKRDLFIINFQSKDLLQWKFKESCLWLRWKKIDC